jgi:molecular chaperone HtpG
MSLMSLRVRYSRLYQAGAKTLMKAWALRDSLMWLDIASNKTFELNLHTRLFASSRQRFSRTRVSDCTRIHLSSSGDRTLTSGFSLDNPTSVTKRINSVIALRLDANEDAKPTSVFVIPSDILTLRRQLLLLWKLSRTTGRPALS